MDIREIKALSLRFRRGIERAFNRGLFRKMPFSDFPNACCGDAPELLAQYLIDNDIKGSIQCKYVYGTYRYDDSENKYGHAWLVVNDAYIVDISADQRQFRNDKIFPQDAFQPCFVGTNSQFHSLFEIEPSQCRIFFSLQDLGELAYSRMKKIYDVILDNIETN